MNLENNNRPTDAAIQGRVKAKQKRENEQQEQRDREEQKRRADKEKELTQISQVGLPAVDGEEAEVEQEMDMCDPPLESKEELRGGLIQAGISCIVFVVLCAIGSILLSLIVQLVFHASSAIIRVASAIGVILFTIFILHATAERFCARGKDGRPQIPKFVFIILVLVALTSSVVLAFVGMEYLAAQARLASGNLDAQEAHKIAVDLNRESSYARILLGVGLECVAAIAGLYGLGLFLYNWPRFNLYRERKKYRQERKKLASRKIELENDLAGEEKTANNRSVS